MVSHSMTQVGQWSRRIVGGALVLALAGLSAPATTSAAGRIRGHEVIVIEDEIEDEAPWTPPNYDGHTGGGMPSSPSDSDGGGSESGGGLFDGGGYVPSGGGTGGISTAGRAALARLAAAKQDCQVLEGVWGAAVFQDYYTNVAYAGYSCRLKYSNGEYEWKYYDSEGNFHYSCVGDLDVQVCDEP